MVSTVTGDDHLVQDLLKKYKIEVKEPKLKTIYDIFVKENIVINHKYEYILKDDRLDN